MGITKKIIKGVKKSSDRVVKEVKVRKYQRRSRRK